MVKNNFSQTKRFKILEKKIWESVFKNGPSKLKKFFKGCLQQLLLGPFLNKLSHI